MLYEFGGVCQHCASEVSITVHNGKPLNHCRECGNEPFSLAQYKGLVYILNNPNQPGVKIGKTTGPVEKRAQQLSSSTGVPGKFEIVAIFPTNTPDKDEKKVHEKLKKLRLDKEHFTLEPVEAVLKVYRTFSKRREPIFYDDQTRETFLLELERAKIDMKLKLKGR